MHHYKNANSEIVSTHFDTTTVSTKSETINLHSHHKLHGFLRAPFHYFSFTTVVSVMYAEKLFMVYCSVAKISNVNAVHFCWFHYIFRFSFWSTKLRKYYVIFCLSCKARQARKNKQTKPIVKKITQLKWPKYEKTKIPKWN